MQSFSPLPFVVFLDKFSSFEFEPRPFSFFFSRLIPLFFVDSSTKFLDFFSLVGVVPFGPFFGPGSEGHRHPPVCALFGSAVRPLPSPFSRSLTDVFSRPGYFIRPPICLAPISVLGHRSRYRFFAQSFPCSIQTSLPPQRTWTCLLLFSPQNPSVSLNCGKRRAHFFFFNVIRIAPGCSWNFPSVDRVPFFSPYFFFPRAWFFPLPFPSPVFHACPSFSSLRDRRLFYVLDRFFFFALSPPFSLATPRAPSLRTRSPRRFSFAEAGKLPFFPFVTRFAVL